MKEEKIIDVKPKERPITELEVQELKAVLFDLSQEVQIKQEQYNQVMNVLQEKMKEKE